MVQGDVGGDLAPVGQLEANVSPPGLLDGGGAVLPATECAGGASAGWFGDRNELTVDRDGGEGQGVAAGEPPSADHRHQGGVSLADDPDRPTADRDPLPDIRTPLIQAGLREGSVRLPLNLVPILARPPVWLRLSSRLPQRCRCLLETFRRTSRRWAWVASS
jgi:hypothetical protein